MLDGTIHLSAVLFGLERLALVVFFFTSSQSDVHLCTSVIINEEVLVLPWE